MANGIIDLGTSGMITGRVVWSSESNGTTANTSTVTVTIQVKRTNSYTTTGTWTGATDIAGTIVQFSKYAAVSSSWVTLATQTKTVAHANNGSGTCYIAGHIIGPSETSQANSSVKSNQTVTLDNIPRAAYIVSAPSYFNDTSNPTITYSNPVGGSVTSLQACIAVYNEDEDIYDPIVPYRDIDKTGTSYTFVLTTDEKTALYNKTPNSNTLEVRFYVQTVLSGSTYRNTKDSEMRIVNAAPRIYNIADDHYTPLIEDINPVTLALTNNKNRLIRYASNAAVTWTVSPQKGATIVSQSVTCGSAKLTQPGTIYGIESDEFVYRATDSRGNSTTDVRSPLFVNYIYLTSSLTVTKPDGEGNMTINVTGKCFNGSFGAVDNNVTIEYRYTESGGTFPETWEEYPATLSGNTYSASIAVTVPNYEKSYTIQARAKDKLMQTVKSEVSVKAVPVFDWGENDFNFNVPVNVNGGLTVNGAEFGANNLLWSGNLFMNEYHTASLSANVSNQPHGIVLIFSRWHLTNQEALNTDFHCFFVPKYMVSNHGECLFTFNMFDVTFEYAASKTLYISDGTIKGYSNNAYNDSEDGDGSSVFPNWNNKHYVLRYVIGV